MQAVVGVKFIADHMKQQDEENMVGFFLSHRVFTCSESRLAGTVYTWRQKH